MGWLWDPACLRAGGHFCTSSDMPLVALLGMLATTQLQVMADEEPAPTAPTPRVPEMSAPPTGTKCQHHSSDQDVLVPRQEEKETVEPDYTSEECSHKKRKREGWWQRPLKNPTVRPSLRSQQSCGWPGEPISRPTGPTLSRRGQMTSPACFDKLLPPIISWALRSMRCGRTGAAGGISKPPTGSPSPLPRTSTSSGM